MNQLTAPLFVIAGDAVGFNIPDQSPEAIRAQIDAFTLRLLALPVEDQREFEVDHLFIEGVYMRKLLIPKGSFLVGQIHLKECMNVVAKGDISVVTETGCGRFQAGYTAISAPGIQKVGFAHEDTIFLNVFRTDETSIERVEAEIARKGELCLS